MKSFKTIISRHLIRTRMKEDTLISPTFKDIIDRAYRGCLYSSIYCSLDGIYTNRWYSRQKDILTPIKRLNNPPHSIYSNLPLNRIKLKHYKKRSRRSIKC